MKFIIIVAFFIGTNLNFGQNDPIETKNSLVLIPEVMVGKTLPANTDFPETNLQTGLILGIAKNNETNTQEWAKRLNFPVTGIALAFIDFGNSENLGQAYSLLPFAEFKAFKRWNLNVGLGISYMNTLWDKETNPFNEAITTHLNWSFRSFLHYDVIQTQSLDWRFGLGYFHHSNGHTRLPNQGLNSLLASVSAKIKNKQDPQAKNDISFENSSQTYFSTRLGLGQNTLSEVINDKKPVYSVAFSMGKIINKTFKFGGGFYYRFYQHYYDYINNDGELIETDYPVFKENPFGYASNFGLFATSELLIGHVGFEFELGLNIYKPFYKVDWILNEGYSFETAQGETIVVLGELDWYYEIKRTVSSRFGLKYYVINNSKAPKNNLYIGAHINANLGQADFTDLSIGYVYRFSKN